MLPLSSRFFSLSFERSFAFYSICLEESFLEKKNKLEKKNYKYYRLGLRRLEDSNKREKEIKCFYFLVIVCTSTFIKGYLLSGSLGITAFEAFVKYFN